KFEGLPVLILALQQLDALDFFQELSPRRVRLVLQELVQVIDVFLDFAPPRLEVLEEGVAIIEVELVGPGFLDQGEPHSIQVLEVSLQRLKTLSRPLAGLLDRLIVQAIEVGEQTGHAKHTILDVAHPVTPVTFQLSANFPFWIEAHGANDGTLVEDLDRKVDE